MSGGARSLCLLHDEQHAIMVELGLDRLPEPNDVADACAAALCHFHISRNQRLLKGI